MEIVQFIQEYCIDIWMMLIIIITLLWALSELKND